MQRISNKNSGNRGCGQTKHMMGSKSFAQISYEMVMTLQALVNVSLLNQVFIVFMLAKIRGTQKLGKSLMIWIFGQKHTVRKGNGQTMHLRLSMCLCKIFYNPY